MEILHLLKIFPDWDFLLVEIFHRRKLIHLLNFSFFVILFPLQFIFSGNVSSLDTFTGGNFSTVETFFRWNFFFRWKFFIIGYLPSVEIFYWWKFLPVEIFHISLVNSLSLLGAMILWRLSIDDILPRRKEKFPPDAHLKLTIFRDNFSLCI